jgi:hypothetical protein
MELNSMNQSRLEQLVKQTSIAELAESGLLGESPAKISRNSRGTTRRKFIYGISVLVYGALEEACTKENGENDLNPVGPGPVPTGAVATGRLVRVSNPRQGYDEGNANFGNIIGNQNITTGGNYRVENVPATTMNASFNGLHRSECTASG